MVKNGIFEKIKISQYRRVLLKNAVIGALIGYFILHPFVMFITHLMHFHVEDGYLHLHSFYEALSWIPISFVPGMLPWAGAFTVFGAVIGLYYGSLMNNLAVLNERLQHNLLERKRIDKELLLIQKINNILNAGVGQKEVFRTLVDGLQSLYNYDSVAIHLLSKDQRHLIIKNYSADSKVVKKLEKLIGLTVIGYEAPLYEGSLLKKIVDTKKPVITDDIVWVLNSYTEKKSLQRMAKIAARLTKAKWGVGVPLMAGDNVVGTIGCGAVEKPTEEDANRLAGFSAQAGLAILRAEKTEELKKLNELKDLFIDIMRHDLINPISTIKNLAELLESEESAKDFQEDINQIKINAERLEEMIFSVSRLAKIESREDMDFEDGDLASIVSESVDILGNKAKDKDIVFVNNIKGEYPIKVNPSIIDVFTNLVSNAIKYSPEKSRVYLDIRDRGDSWRVMVKDNGEGVPDEYKELIFNRFGRLKKTGVKGLGLGLAITKKIVELHNGRVLVEDNPEGGSIFVVEIPKVVR